jgi:hypothetical protein
MNTTATAASNLPQQVGNRKNALLNKFLSKTFHMIDNCPTDIATWSNSGDSFTIKDVQRFEKECLPKYFNHSKFSSFVRQLNFYNFQKLRGDPDLQIHTDSVRFAHEFFKMGRPDLLHKIQRSTAIQKPFGENQEHQLEALHQKVEMLQRKIFDLERSVDEKVEKAILSVTEGYMTRIHKMETSYGMLINGIVGNLSSSDSFSRSWVSTTNRNNSLSLNPTKPNLVSYIPSNPSA